MCLLEITDLLYLIRIVGIVPLINILTPEGIPAPDISLSDCHSKISSVSLSTFCTFHFTPRAGSAVAARPEV